MVLRLSGGRSCSLLSKSDLEQTGLYLELFDRKAGDCEYDGLGQYLQQKEVNILTNMNTIDACSKLTPNSSIPKK